MGSETFISLVDLNEAPYSASLKQLEVDALCTNRDLPLHTEFGRSDTDFTLDVSAPIEAIRCVHGPSRPKASLAAHEGEASWKLINQLALNYSSLIDTAQHQGASALKQLLNLYIDSNDVVMRKQVEGILAIEAEYVTRRIPVSGPIVFGRGVELTVLFDESAFVGSGIFLLGTILDHFFARYVAINSFTQTVIKSQTRGEVKRWPVRMGQKHIV
jgi:type VI secretion system protein ImpG